MHDALNAHIEEEMYSSNLYLAMAAYCESVNFKGFSHWMRIQAKEEYAHAMKIFDYLIDRGGRVQIRAVTEPPNEYKSPRDVFEKTLAHEKDVTKKVHKLYELALQEKDYATQALLQWFITEQVEEEKTSRQIVDTLRTIGTNTSGLYMLDRELGRRGQAG